MKFKVTFVLPKKISDWVIVISCLIYFIIDFTVDFQSFAQQILTGSEPLKYWLLRRIRDISFTVFIASMIVFGIREVRYNGKTFKNLIVPVFGVILCCSLVIISWYTETLSANIHNALFVETVILDKTKNKLESPNLPIAQKMELSHRYAKIFYQRYGKQIEYLTQNETYVLYEPTEEDKGFYKEYLSGKKAVDLLIRGMHRSKYLWLIVLGISLLLGFITPLKKMGNANQLPELR